MNTDKVGFKNLVSRQSSIRVSLDESRVSDKNTVLVDHVRRIAPTFHVGGDGPRKDNKINLSHREAMCGGGSYSSVLDTWRSEGLLGFSGSPRLNWARYRLLNDYLDEESRVLLVNLFNEWRFFDEYMILQKKRIHDWKIIENIAVKCAKRGNDVYRWRMMKRLSWISDVLKDFGDLRVLDQNNRSRVLCVTLTYDPRVGSMREAWENIGDDWNRFITAVRKKWGNVYALRVFESTGKGYPHVHALMIFEDHCFKTYRHQGKDGQITLRIRNKGEFEGYHHSYIDVFSPYSLGFGIRYFTKYLGKVHRDTRYMNDGGLDLSKFDQTLAMMWLYRKRSFSLSRELQRSISDLIKRLHNSNFFGVGQVDLFGDSVYEWVFLGVYPGSVIGIDGGFWSVRLKDLSFIGF